MKFKFLLFLPVLVIFIAGFYYYFNLQPVSSQKQLHTFTVNQGEGLSTIASRLKQNHLVRNYYIFVFSAYRLGLNNKLRAGIFELSPHLSTPAIIHLLSTTGSPDIWLKIIPGARLEEIAPLLEPFNIPRLTFLNHPQAKEGYLNPDSYKIPNYYNLDQILTIISRKTPIDPSTLILASLLEREARSLTAKQQIAGILLNRLEINMPLQVDATIQYARDSRPPYPKTYWQAINQNDLKIRSPYNTYLYRGLPPSPICNPGSESVNAVLNPTKSDYLFYITGTDGLLHVAKTLDEHNANIRKYLN
jgi:UPF0755 protein